jgi:putative chitinase
MLRTGEENNSAPSAFALRRTSRVRIFVSSTGAFAMRGIDAALLRDIAQGPASLADALAPALAHALPAAAIDAPLALAHFLAQACYETWNFARLEEDLDYTAPRIAKLWPRLAGRAAELAHRPEALASAAYAHAIGNGDEASGDGWRFRGRGLFQLTGRNNYALAAAQNDPDSVGTPDGAVSSAIAFWKARRIGLAASAGNIARVTRLVNGTNEGLTERAQLTRRALALLSTN